MFGHPEQYHQNVENGYDTSQEILTQGALKFSRWIQIIWLDVLLYFDLRGYETVCVIFLISYAAKITFLYTTHRTEHVKR